MPEFNYKARTMSGSMETGLINASDSRNALLILRERGLFVTKIKQKKKSFLSSIDFSNLFSRPINSRDIAVWANQFSAMYTAGVPISYIILTLSQQTNNQSFSKVQLNLLEDVNQGIPLADAMEKYPRYFPELMINMFRVGEEAGVMEQSLQQIVRFYTQEHEMGQKIKTAMYYPIIVLVMSVGVIWLLMTRMVPAFLEAYSSMGSDLPIVTRILIKTSDFMIDHGLLVMIGLALIVVLVIFWSRSKSGRVFFDTLRLRIPVFGELALLNSIARFCRVLSTLQKHGIDMLTALSLVERSIHNVVLGNIVREAKADASRGQSIAKAFSSSKYFPPLVVNMIRVGEESGSIDTMLEKAAEMYEVDVKNMSERLNTMLEPMINLFLAVVVGGILVAIIVPMFSMYNMVG